MLQWLLMDEIPLSTELEAELEYERAERERLFGAQSRLYASVSTGSENVERPADETFTCSACEIDVLPSEALTAAWVERKTRDIDGAWWPAGVELLVTACPADRETLLAGVISRATDLAAAASANSLAQEAFITYAHSVIDWPAELPGVPE